MGRFVDLHQYWMLRRRDSENRRFLLNSPLRDIRIVVVDIETTGMNLWNGDCIISLGAIAVEGLSINSDQCFHQVVNPRRSIPSNIERLTGIKNSAVGGKPFLEDILTHFVEFLDNSVIAGHSLGFDFRFLSPSIQGICGVKLKNPIIDTRWLGRVLYPWEDHCLNTLLQINGIQRDGRHSALWDAFLTAKLLIKMWKNVETRGIYTLNNVYRYLQHTQPWG